MILTKNLRTAESVTPKHPDKLCDQISDLVLDHCLETDPFSRVAMETAGGHKKIFLTGEITTTAVIDFKELVSRLVGTDYEVSTSVSQQSTEIARGVNIGGAGDQGVMNGYACSDNESLIPHETYLARELAKMIYIDHPFDGKTQITLNKNDELVAVVASFQNTKAKDLKNYVNRFIDEYYVKPAQDIKIFTNPTGDWNQGGFEADAGVTGRKLAIDNYGPGIPIGGGAFSGKDPTKVDRSAAYMARKIAVDYLQKKGAENVFVQLAYSIGVAEPVEALALVDGKIEKIEGYDLTPFGIIEFLDLRKPQYAKTAQWGHMGNGFAWDK